MVRSLLPVGCLPNFAPSRLSVRRPRPHYRCAPNRNRSPYYELTWTLIAQRPVSTRDSAKQLDLFEEVTHSPYQPGGKRRREVSADLIPAETSLVIRHSSCCLASLRATNDSNLRFLLKLLGRSTHSKWPGRKEIIHAEAQGTLRSCRFLLSDLRASA